MGHGILRCRFVFLFVLAAGLALSGSAAWARDVRVSGFGVRKCGEWEGWKTAKNGEARALTVEWVTGFLAGHNVYARNGNEAANSVVADPKTLATLLDSYCQKNPDGRIFAGAIDIARSLGGAKVMVSPTAPDAPDAPGSNAPGTILPPAKPGAPKGAGEV